MAYFEVAAHVKSEYVFIVEADTIEQARGYVGLYKGKAPCIETVYSDIIEVTEIINVTGD